MPTESPIIKGLMFLADKLFSLSDTIKKSRRNQKDRVAEYCERISDTLTQAFKELEKGIIPHGLCAQMDSYMRDLKSVLKDTLSDDEYNDLREVLQVAYEVEHIDRELQNPPRKGSKYAELDIAAGKFRAVADKIRAT